MTLSSMTIVFQLTFLECILSIDNAAIMGAMVAHLPDDRPTPWPRWLRGWGSRLDRVLGSQRSAALKVGLFGAYTARLVMLALTTVLIAIPWVQILGALYLVYLAVDHFGALRDAGADEAVAGAPLSAARGFWTVVLMLNLADVAFSLDNVVAAVALSDRFWVVAAGVGIGMLAIRSGATLFTRLIRWEPAMEQAAYLLLLAIGGELIAEHLLGIEIGDWTRFGISVGVLLLVLGFARLSVLRRMRVIFRPLLALSVGVHQGLGMLSGLMLLPFRQHS